MIASLTTLPVIGVPIKSSNSIDGWDSVLSILQMPGGVPVATVALDGRKMRHHCSANILDTSDKKVAEKLSHYKQQLEKSVLEKVNTIAADWQNNFDSK
jgi:5-(carboxyamino)imidazole ribonucleotide mutase